MRPTSESHYSAPLPAASAAPGPPPQLLDDGWAPRTTLAADANAAKAAEMLLSHVSFLAADKKDAAYAFSLFGPCKPASQLGLLTAITLLRKLQPVFPIVAMLGEDCWVTSSLRRQLVGLGALTELVPEVQNVTCSGRRYGPDSKMLSADVNASYFDATYTILGAWNLTKYRAVMVLDSDLAVRRSLDHVLVAMLARPEIAEARTPEGCLDAIASHPWRGNYFNTGVWGVRPHAEVYKSIVHFLQHNGGEMQCGIGIQTAAHGFFGRKRADPMRFDPRSADVDRNSVGAAPWATYYGKGPSPQAERRKIFSDPRMRPWEILQLHAGYNLKANQGPMGCLRKHRHNVNDSAYVVHWSGSRKPHTLKPQQTLDTIERAAHADFMHARCGLWVSHFADADIPHFQKQCGAIVSLPPESPLMAAGGGGGSAGKSATTIRRIGGKAGKSGGG